LRYTAGGKMQEIIEQTELKGCVENITYRREDSGFSVLDISCEGELITVVGVLPQVSVGEELRLRGHWDFHPSFGRQFRAELCEHSLPTTAADLLKYLSSGIIKGIGPATAIKIVEKFGDNSFDVLENDPRRLSSIKGISLAKAEKICEGFKAQFAVREVMISLERFGMSPAECLSAYKIFGVNAVETITNNPYALCNEGIGIGFERADSIAAALPEKPLNAYRNASGVIHIIRHNLSNGHTCLPRDKIFYPCRELLDIGQETVDATADLLVEQGQIVQKTVNGREFLFLPAMYLAEKSIADHIKMMLRFPPAGRETLGSEIKKVEKQQGLLFEEKQRLAIETAIQKGVLILTGGPGTGKTTTINGILKLFELSGLSVALAAPTGRAAKRMSEVTGKEAKTMHRLLEVEWDKDDKPVFARNIRNPLSEDAVIIDELSMVDVHLFSSLLNALPIGCRLVMVGDSDQLPPVGAGNVLHDLIASGLLPVVELKEIFRQAMESMIVLNAHRIVRGEMPVLDSKDKDFFFIERNSVSAAAQTICELCSTRLPAAYGFSPISDIQVLCPTRKGESGTVSLNKQLQAVLNPGNNSKKEIAIKTNVFREGDKVMQVKNNYNIDWVKGDEKGAGIFNGDVGILKEIDVSSATLKILFDDREALYTFEQAADLELAYAVTVHKSQGNEFDAVILPAIGIVPQLAYRNLLYTAVTRAKKMMIIVGNALQIKEMAENDRKSKRYSALNSFLSEE
jgi:exodeoxyribonuclease V alpha subunit